MARILQNGGLFQDENLSVHYNGSAVAGKANVMNSQRKSGISGRKPLGDLSNSRKPVLNQSSKGQNTKNLTFIDEENGAGIKKNKLKGSERVQKGSRKVLSDISNFGKNNHNAICEERFVHNHQECIKAQNYRDKDHFLSIIGLDPSKELKISTERKPDSPLKLLKEMEELAEFDHSPNKLSLFGRGGIESPTPCKSPESPSVDHYSAWKSVWIDDDSFDFTLIKTP